MRPLTPALLAAVFPVISALLENHHEHPTHRQRSQDISLSNGSLPVYRDPSSCVEERVDDLLQRMTLEEKAGQMFHNQIRIGENYTLDKGVYEENAPSRWNSTENMVGEKHMTHFNLMGAVDDPAEVARWYNLLQQRALDTRLGIPITISTDPRHHFNDAIGAGVGIGALSQWPESLGLSALRDPELVRTFANIAREEYTAVGIRAALHPQVDLATEPRWARIFNSWSEDADLTSEMIVAYIEGFRGGPEFGSQSVSTVTKHFPGGGAKEDGEDSHFVYGKNQTYPGNNFEYHLKPFKAAFKAGTRQVMPYYSRPINTQYNDVQLEEVGFAFNKQIVTWLLREEMGFDGVVLTDWGLITDAFTLGYEFPARAWGMENASELERVRRVIDAGCDQFGGEERTDLVVQLVEEGVISEERIDVSVRRLLREKFIMGLFDNPFVDPEIAARTVGNPYFTRLGAEAQRHSNVLLTNNDEILPLRNPESGLRVYTEGIEPELIASRDLDWTLVDNVAQADLALLRLLPPHDNRTDTLAEAIGFREGTLEYTDTEKERQAAIYSQVPTIVDMYLDRPAAFPEVVEQASAVLASFGSDSDAFLDLVLGDFEPLGQLPFDLPRSDETVRAQMEDVPFDTRDPVFKFGHGLRYHNRCTGSITGSCS